MNASRDMWRSEVDAVLRELSAAMEARIGTAVACQLQGRGALDVIEPRFVVRGRLDHFADPPGRMVSSHRTAAVEVIRRMWTTCRDAHPDLWSYQAWHRRLVGDTDSQRLSAQDFAERMKQKRHAQHQKAAEATEPLDPFDPRYDPAGRVEHDEHDEHEDRASSGAVFAAAEDDAEVESAG